jgi:tetratricopeptide (TPR) repeat protein
MLHRLAPGAVQKRHHLLVAQWLEHRLGERAEEQCEQLAHHYELGGARLPAAHNFVSAGDRARARAAHVKAAEHYTRGLELLGEDDAARRIDALHSLGEASLSAGRNDDAARAFAQMSVLAWRLDLERKGALAHHRLGRLHLDAGRLDEAARHIGAALALFEVLGDEPGKAASQDDLARLHRARGDGPAARAEPGTTTGETHVLSDTDVELLE